jgi:hypothetical protein
VTGSCHRPPPQTNIKWPLPWRRRQLICSFLPSSFISWPRSVCCRLSLRRLHLALPFAAFVETHWDWHAHHRPGSASGFRPFPGAPSALFLPLDENYAAPSRAPAQRLPMETSSALCFTPCIAFLLLLSFYSPRANSSFATRYRCLAF